MKTKFLIFALSAISYLQVSAQLFSTSSGFVGFYSKTNLEDVKAENNSAFAMINIPKRELAFIVTNTAFDFPNKLMQEHFNEKYIESEKYPRSTFSGTINENVDLSKDGEYKVNVAGKLKIHGVEQPRTISGTITVKDGNIKLVSSFKVKAADHKITIPSVVMVKLAEEMDVNVNATLVPKK